MAWFLHVIKNIIPEQILPSRRYTVHYYDYHLNLVSLRSMLRHSTNFLLIKCRHFTALTLFVSSVISCGVWFAEELLDCSLCWVLTRCDTGVHFLQLAAGNWGENVEMKIKEVIQSNTWKLWSKNLLGVFEFSWMLFVLMAGKRLK